MSRDPGQDVASLRREYADLGLTEADLAPDPVTMFGRWFDDAVAAGLHEPNAMVVATVSADGRPASRMVLLKGLDDAGLRVLHQPGVPQGGRARGQPALLAALPLAPARAAGADRRHGDAAAARGRRRRTSPRRPRGARLGAHACHQSRVVSGREELMAAYAEAEARFGDGDVPVPEEWGGYRVTPEAVEFWQGRPGRMHDRLVYRRTNGGWATERLAP